MGSPAEASRDIASTVGVASPSDDGVVPLQSETVILTCGNRSEPARHSRTAALLVIVHGPEPPGGRWKDWAKGGHLPAPTTLQFHLWQARVTASERTLIGS